MCDFYVPTPRDTLIGKGGFGSVYLAPGKKCVVKISHLPLPCAAAQHEYDMSIRLRDAMDKTLTEHEKRTIGIIRPSAFGTCDKRCCFAMQHLLPLQSTDSNVTQAYLALPTHAKNIRNAREIRGMYRGAKEIGVFVDADKVAYRVGLAVGIMHFVAEMSGVDSEVVLAKLSADGPPKVFIIDHDRNTTLDLKKPGRVISLLSGLLGSGEPYFPMRGPLAEHFADGYLEAAKRARGRITIARDILSAAVLEYDTNPPLPL